MKHDQTAVIPLDGNHSYNAICALQSHKHIKQNKTAIAIISLFVHNELTNTYTHILSDQSRCHIATYTLTNTHTHIEKRPSHQIEITVIPLIIHNKNTYTHTIRSKSLTCCYLYTTNTYTHHAIKVKSQPHRFVCITNTQAHIHTYHQIKVAIWVGHVIRPAVTHVVVLLRYI
jgi:hypothetical protein